MFLSPLKQKFSVPSRAEQRMHKKSRLGDAYDLDEDYEDEES